MLNASKHIPVWPTCSHGRAFLLLALLCMGLCLTAIPVLRLSCPFVPRGLLFVLAVFTYDLVSQCMRRTEDRDSNCRDCRARHLFLHVYTPLIWFSLSALYVWMPY